MRLPLNEGHILFNQYISTNLIREPDFILFLILT